MEFFKIRRTIPFMRYALIFNVISAMTFLAAVPSKYFTIVPPKRCCTGTVFGTC